MQLRTMIFQVLVELTVRLLLAMTGLITLQLFRVVFRVWCFFFFSSRIYKTRKELIASH